MQRRTKTGLATAAAVTVAAGLGAVAITGASADTSEPEQEAPDLAIAEPGGAFATGTTDLHLVDEDRADVWVPQEHRELMVSMWYPTDDDGQTAPYMSGEESALFGEQMEVPADLLASVATNSTVDAAPLAEAGELPLVMLSPGFSFPRATLTGVAEELASQGYAVAAVGHNYEAPITFPDRTTECLACDDMQPETLVPNRSEDLSFVLDELTEGAAPEGLRIDADRVIAGGHSIGGAGGHRAMLDDDRFDAGFNLDGTFYALGEASLDRPFLIMGAQDHGQPGEDPTWTDAWDRLEGWKRWTTVEGTTHSSLTDLAPLGAQAGAPSQDLDGEYCDQLARAHLTAFADLHLRGEEAPILDGPNDTWPEVEFHNP